MPPGPLPPSRSGRTSSNVSCLSLVARSARLIGTNQFLYRNAQARSRLSGRLTLEEGGCGAMDSPLIVSVLLPAAIAVIMCSLGMELSRDDFRRVLTAPRGVAIGMLNLALISPLLALAMGKLFGLPPELAVGLVLLGASPGGMMANMLTHLSRGDTALSVTMTAISSVGAMVTVPLFLELSAGYFGATGLGDVSMLAIVV